MDIKVIKKIANLSKLELTDDELEKFSGQLTQIMKYFEELQELNTDGIEPLITPTPIEFSTREDLLSREEYQERILTNVPERSGNLIKVPPVV